MKTALMPLEPPALPPGHPLPTQPRSDPGVTPGTARGAGSAWGGVAWSNPWRWVGDAVGAAGVVAHEAAAVLASPRAGRHMHEFADIVTSAREPEAVESALVRVAAALSGARRAELVLDRDERTNPDPVLMAVWPEGAAGEAVAPGSPLCLGLWCGAHYRMTLQLFGRTGAWWRGPAWWSPRVVRRLTTLCAMAAAAERGLHASQRGRREAPVEASATVRDATFLNAVLPYALAQADRHGESLTVFCLAVDGMTSLARAFGTSAVDNAVGRVAHCVASTLRGSDVVARLDDDRVIVVLPNTGRPDALAVAGVLRSALVGACLPTGKLPALTVSIGVACYPFEAREMLGLLHAADEAMERSRASAPDRCREDAATATAPFSGPHHTLRARQAG